MDRADAFAELFRREYPTLVLELRLILREPALAEEVAAEAFLEGWRTWDTVAALERPGAWLRKIALHKASRARWRRGRRRSVESAYAPQMGGTPRDLDVLAALRELSEAQRTAVVLHHLGGWPTRDIAEVLGCADVTVRAHLSRGRQRLRELLDDTTETRHEEREVDDATNE